MRNLNGRYLFTSESVGEGHPDKVADQVSDAILDAIICNDPKARVDAETLVMQGNVVVTGQITTSCYVSIPKIVRKTLKDIGLDNAKMAWTGKLAEFWFPSRSNLQTSLWE